MGKLVLCYWPLRGLGAPAVNMLEYSGIDYEHKIAGEEWFDQKFNLGFDFPNLPYVIDGDVRLTESWAIYKYIGRKLNLYPPNGEEYQRQSDVLQVIHDIGINFATHCYNPDLYSLTDKLLETQEQKFNLLEKYLESRKFLIADKLTYLDFVLFETLDQHRLFFTGIYSKYPNITAYMKRFESLDRLEAYFKSERYHQFPIRGKDAIWGGQKHNDRKWERS